RHTRCYRDWSSDVCSSDLVAAASKTSMRDKMENIVFSRIRAPGPPFRLRPGKKTAALFCRLRDSPVSEVVLDAGTDRAHLVVCKIGRASCRDPASLTAPAP